ncbi:hypothetical protein UA75_01290 [Actinoalloteichus sp. GBA129-24]|uniref:Uncharacterized protein n=1 Tax=Actinoalloteichus fjordicus TaxID=1612552 RepID=A0AAC9L6L9_9PSEU|nr:hypothetical protein UA74_01290 [Actinoalloteichus fjordicus]APU18300.1 hypothetical protein UA75_01290 [Actinoalloteichus sp. GBA129-24]
MSLFGVALLTAEPASADAQAERAKASVLIAARLAAVASAVVLRW